MLKKNAFLILLVFSSCNLFEENEKLSQIQFLSEKIAKNPNDIDLLYERVEYNKLKNNLESVLYDLKQIIHLDSLNTKHHNQIAMIYFDLSKIENANPQYPKLVKDHLTRSIALNQNQSKPHALMGELLLAYGEYKDAIEQFNTSLKLEYNQEKTHLLMGYAFKQLQKNDNAIDCFRNSINVNPDYFEGHMQLGQIFHLLGDSSAIIYYDNALRLDEDNEMVLYNKALFFQSKKKWNNALDIYAQLHKVNAFHSSAHYNLGFIHMELGLYDVAANNFSDAIYADSEFYEAYYSRGNCFETLGNILQAESDYVRAIEIKSDYKYAIQALESLRNMNKKYNK